MTNREWLNNLSNEELIHYLIAQCNMCAYAGKGCMEHDEWNCFEGCEKWLEQEHHCEDGREDEYETPDDIREV